MEREELEKLCCRLPEKLAVQLRGLPAQERRALEEIRIYAGSDAELVINGAARKIPVRPEMDELLAMLSAQALYRCEREMAMGYIPLPGGHRAGVCGRMICQVDGTWQMTQISSVCIRIGRHIPDASLPIREYLLDQQGCAQRVLVLGPPGSGKTTVLRDAALWLSRNGVRVAVADEREELFPGGARCADIRMDVLGGMDKARALSRLIRSMAPQMVITDEIGRDEDAQAVLDALRCGVGLLASAHARSMEEAAQRPAIGALLSQHAFDWYVLLGRRAQVLGVYGDTDKGEMELGQLGCGCHGDDRHQRGGIFAV